MPSLCGSDRQVRRSASDQGASATEISDRHACMVRDVGVISENLCRPAGIPFVEMRAEINPSVSGHQPRADSAAHCRDTEAGRRRRLRCAGLVTDGDADRIGAVDEHGNVVDAHKIFAILLQWLLERKGWPGDVTQCFQHDQDAGPDRGQAWPDKLHEHGIGFKYVCDLMLEKDILIGGEESGGVGISKHLPERDGMLNSLLLAQVMADEKKTLGQLVAALQAEYGEHQYGRIDMHIDEQLKLGAIARAKEIQPGDPFAGMTVLKVETMDGIKFFLENKTCASKPNAAETWLLLRASGTEPLLRVYCESCSVESVNAVLKRGQGASSSRGKGLRLVVAETVC